jgi:hypothetical protein
VSGGDGIAAWRRVWVRAGWRVAERVALSVVRRSGKKASAAFVRPPFPRLLRRPSLGRMIPAPPGREPLSDEELDRFIELRLRMAGVDLSVLPENDPSAPADQLRVLRSARNFLRNTASALSAAELDPQVVPPIPSTAAYPYLATAAPGNEDEAR